MDLDAGVLVPPMQTKCAWHENFTLISTKFEGKLNKSTQTETPNNTNNEMKILLLKSHYITTLICRAFLSVIRSDKCSLKM
jgi:hypothetical protein